MLVERGICLAIDLRSGHRENLIGRYRSTPPCLELHASSVFYEFSGSRTVSHPSVAKRAAVDTPNAIWLAKLRSPDTSTRASKPMQRARSGPKHPEVDPTDARNATR